MGIIEHITLPDSPGAKAVSLYRTSQEKRDFSSGDKLFTDDVVFNGLLYKVAGGEAVTKGFQDFVDNMLKSIRVEAITRVDGSCDHHSEKWLVLFFSVFAGSDAEVVAVDLITTRGSRVSRVDNCFDTEKVSDVIKQNAKETSTLPQ